MKETEGKEDKMDGQDLDALLVDLFVGLATLNNEAESSLFLSDLLSKSEARILARRLRIAVLLAAGCTYRDIEEVLSTSTVTIRAVNTWLQLQGDGYQMVINRLGEMADVKQMVRERRSRRRKAPKNSTGVPNARTPKKHAKYSECFWPIEVAEAIVKGIETAKKKNGSKKKPL